MPKSILIVDDDDMQRKMLQTIFDRAGYYTQTAENGEAALDLLSGRNRVAVDIVLLDLLMDGLGGIEVLQRLHPLQPDLPVIVLTGHSSVDIAVEAMRAGATDFITKPVSPDRLIVSVRNALKLNELSDEVSRLTRKWDGQFSFADLIGESEVMKKAISMAQKGASSHVPILLEGESGVGKEVFARAIQGASDRAGQPFVVVNCGAIPENLVESILFGHEKGAFTGATEKHDGKFIEADGGTLFLDEIGELPLDLQVKLLRVLQEGEVDPVGGSDPIKVDVRLISATNRDLLSQVEVGAFREDLYYRLNVFPITLPPLRERLGDVRLLIDYFIDHIALAEGRGTKTITAEAVALLEGYHWPGNVRQLENAIFRAIILSESDEMGADDFPQIQSAVRQFLPLERSPFDKVMLSSDVESVSGNGHQNDRGAVYADSEVNIPVRLFNEDGDIRKLSEVEADIIEYALEKYDRHMSEIARRLGIGRSTLYRKIEEIGLLDD